MKSMRKIFWAALACLAVACSKPEPKEQQSVAEQPKAEATVLPLVAQLEKAHQKAAFLQKKAISFDLKLLFRGKERLNGTLEMTTNSAHVKLTDGKGHRLYFDGTDVYLFPADTTYKSARFDALTWSYFFAVPFKLSDAGTHWESLGTLPFEKNELSAAKLTFDSGTGDSPDDWYIAYQNDSTGLLEGLAYIVTFGDTPVEKAETSPHAIRYTHYQIVQGIPLATQWSFFDWNKSTGIAAQLGSAQLSNFRFFEPEASHFDVPSEAQKVPL